jgi:hypothetical protein
VDFYHQKIEVDDASGKKKHGFTMKKLDLRLPGQTIFGGGTKIEFLQC